MANRLILGFAEYVAPMEKILFGLPHCDEKYPSYETIVAQIVKNAGSSYFEEDLEQYCREISFHFSDDLSYIVNDIVPLIVKLTRLIRLKYMQLGCMDSENSCAYRFSGFVNRYDIVVWRD